MTRGTLYGIGVGPGDPELLTLKAVRILSDCAVIAYPAPEAGESLARAIAAPHLASRQRQEIVIRMALDAQRFPVDAVYDQAAEEIGAVLERGQDVAVLCEGDPFFYGSFLYLFARLAERERVEIIPGICSVMACAAVSRRALAARSDVFSVLPALLPFEVLTARLADADSTALIKIGRHIGKVRAAIAACGLESDAWYIEHATMATERVLPLRAAPLEAPYFSMVLVHRRKAAWQ